jgi:hypothetical protein
LPKIGIRNPALDIIHSESALWEKGGLLFSTEQHNTKLCFFFAMVDSIEFYRGVIIAKTRISGINRNKSRKICPTKTGIFTPPSDYISMLFCHKAFPLGPMLIKYSFLGQPHNHYTLSLSRRALWPDGARHPGGGPPSGGAAGGAHAAAGKPP